MQPTIRYAVALLGMTALVACGTPESAVPEAVAAEEPERLRLALSVYPGLVDTDMQELIRAQSPDVQPDVAWFQQRHDDGAMNDPAWVARHIAGWVFGDDPAPSPICQVPDQPR